MIEVYEEVPVPNLTPNGVLCKMLASGVCRSDHSLLTIDNQPSWFEEKYILGHEGCGQVMRLGSAVQTNDIKVGDVVALHAVPGCGEEDCTECSHDLSQLLKVPEGVTPAEAAVATDAVSTAYHAIIRRGEVKKEHTVFLFGLGGLGFNGLQILLYIGARVIISDIRQDLLNEAEHLGIPSSDIVPVGTSPQDFVIESGLSGKIDTVLDFVGTHQTFEDAQHIVRRGGKLLCIGSLDTENTIHMKIGTRKRLSFIFSYGAQVEDLKQVLNLVAAGHIRPRVETRRITEFEQVLDELVEGKIKSRVALLHE
ncbi:uncharacterized protein FIESC28_01132 [Fusarium coffeatum]|uniref:Enoyl reductase (ER) domain-containing protein n=1 Tax=Fusarium coffeatum TaxID=231269 RepID=A0A366S9V8_9HYPO|nr:uncharacterized protein FIESC28_01132 [Fusarium coffeatum]RBR26104.1 hypothetical protein FIESC28_01132 [Fusarium coffeatum]